MLGKKFDISFIVSDTFDGEGGNLNGFYLAGTNKVGIALDAEGDLYLRTAGHECYHYLEKWNKEGAEYLRDIVIAFLKQSKDYNYKEQVERYAKAYKLNVVEEIDAIHSEIVADCMFDVFSNERFVNSLVKENKTLAQKICDFIKELLSEIRNMMKNYHNSPEMEALRDMKALLDNINNIFVYELEIASKNAQKAKNAELQSTAENSEQKNNTTDDGGVKYSLKQYSEHQIENWKNSNKIIVYENDEQLQEFIKDSQNGVGISRKMYFGYISNELADEIKNVTGIDVSNYNCTLRASEVRKILKNHGQEITEKTRGQRAITPDDFELIPKVIQNPDNISLSDKLFEGKPVIVFSKIIDGKIVVSAYVSRKHLDLTVQTMYSGIKKGNLATAAGEQAPANTPEANAGTVSTNIISDKVEKINIKSEKTTVENEKSVKSLKLSPDAKKVLEENPELKSAFLYLQSQFKLVKDYVPGEEQLMNYAKQLKKSNVSTKDVYELKNDLRNIYTILHSMTDSRGLEYATNTALKLATDIMATSKVLDEQNQAKQNKKATL